MTDVPSIVQDIPGKGKGLVAARPLVQGELILAESPLFTQTRPYTNATVLAALASLSDAKQREFFSLANVWQGVHPPPLGVFKTNVLPCGENDANRGVTASVGGIFLLGSRFNSSCEPNVSNYWNAAAGTIQFRSVRAIAEGEELCICYGDVFADRQRRQAELQSAFHFTCACVACSREGAELKDSDQRRVAIARLYNEIGLCGTTPSLGVRKVKQALRLLAAENLLESCGSSFYYDGFQFCISVSDVRNAKSWVKKAWENYCMNRGPTSEDAVKMSRHMENPRGHPSFGLLPKMSLVGPGP